MEWSAYEYFGIDSNGIVIGLPEFIPVLMIDLLDLLGDDVFPVCRQNGLQQIGIEFRCWDICFECVSIRSEAVKANFGKFCFEDFGKQITFKTERDFLVVQIGELESEDIGLHRDPI